MSNDNLFKLGTRFIGGHAIVNSDGNVVSSTNPLPVITSDGISTAITTGTKTVTTAGTAVALAASTICESVLIYPLETNTGVIYVGGSTIEAANGRALYIGDAVSIKIDNLSKVYIDASVSGEGVGYTALA